MNGRDWALKLGERYPGQDWVAELARRAGEPRDKIEWHLQEEMEPPAQIGDAAQDMLDAPAEPREAAPPTEGDPHADDLPFAGVPQFIGKLHKD